MERTAAAGGTIVLAGAAAAFMLTSRAGPGPDNADATPLEASIAVLTFEDLSPGRDHAWFSEGIAEDIQTHLALIGDLKVIGRSSAMRHAGDGRSVREIGEALDVATVLEGSVRRIGNRVRITTKLLRASTEEQLWAESYDRELTDIFALQTEIAGRIADALRTRFSAEQRARLDVAPTANLAAYELYLRGREHAQRLTRGDIERAIALYREALRQDPDYAVVHAALGFAFVSLEGYHGAGAQWLDSAEVAARRAIELDPNAADGYAMLAAAQWNKGRLAEAAATYDRALAIRPNDPFSLWGLAFTRWLDGSVDDALRLARRAVELDPAVPLYTTLLGRCHITLGDVAAGEAWLRRTLELVPDFPWAHQDLLWLHLWHGDHARASAQLPLSQALLPHSPEIIHAGGLQALLEGDYSTAAAVYDVLIRDHSAWKGAPFAEAGFVHAQLGNTARARELWRRGRVHAEASLRRGTDVHHFMHVSLARIALLDDRDADEAMRWLESAYASGWRLHPMRDLADDPLLRGLHGDPRFEGLRTRMRAEVARLRAAALEG
jgi:TolB-like protein/Tfp pilus assembly protein PilF